MNTATNKLSVRKYHMERSITGIKLRKRTLLSKKRNRSGNGQATCSEERMNGVGKAHPMVLIEGKEKQTTKRVI